VRAVLTKVELGEADAGMVYRTDAGLSGDRVETVEVPASAEVVAAYPIGLVRSARNPATARAFIDFVRGEQGQRLLAEAGFAPAK
jgi:molybdate transport system substrate-binding protein